MKLNEHSQNLGGRIITIQVSSVRPSRALLGARTLTTFRSYAAITSANVPKIKGYGLIPIPAPRGAIFDRNGKILVDSRPTFNVVLSNEPIKGIEVDDRSMNMQKAEP
jgi:hypothetical protein